MSTDDLPAEQRAQHRPDYDLHRRAPSELPSDPRRFDENRAAGLRRPDLQTKTGAFAVVLIVAAN